jgi:hypothetical protein
MDRAARRTVPRSQRRHTRHVYTICMQMKSSILVWSFLCTLDEGLARGICRITTESSILARPLRQGRHLPWSSALIHGENKSVAMQMALNPFGSNNNNTSRATG